MAVEQDKRFQTLFNKLGKSNTERAKKLANDILGYALIIMLLAIFIPFLCIACIFAGTALYGICRMMLLTVINIYSYIFCYIGLDGYVFISNETCTNANEAYKIFACQLNDIIYNGKPNKCY